MKQSQIKAIYDATGMHPYEADKALLEKDAQALLKKDERGNIIGINMDAYVEGLKRLAEPPKQNDDALTDIQMRTPAGNWVKFDIYSAHHFINDRKHYVHLRMWKNGKYVMLDGKYVNEGLKNKDSSDLSNVCYIMPKVSPEVEIIDSLNREWVKKMLQQDKQEYANEERYCSLREKTRMGGHI